MTLESPIVDPAEFEAVERRASALMKRGIHLLQESDANAETALQCFDRALELRARLPLDISIHAYGLAACWLNRADALIRLRRANHLADALHAYDEAIALLHRLPVSADARFVRRLAIAHQNRGLVLFAQDPPAVEDAALAYTNAIAVLESEDAAGFPDQPYLLAVVWMNLANALASRMSDEADAAARDAARRAIVLVAPLEAEDADAAEAGLKARHIWCQTLARRLPAPTATAAIPDDVHEATDLADDGLGLVRRWELRGVPRFRALAFDLFRFGAGVYGLFQPQFLPEFIDENLDSHASSMAYAEQMQL